MQAGRSGGDHVLTDTSLPGPTLGHSPIAIGNRRDDSQLPSAPRTQVQGLAWRDTNTGETFSETARVVVLAGGCTETPRLWLNSGLPNPNGWVGRGYTDHAFDWIVGVFPFKTNSSRGVGSSARIDYPGYGGMEQVGLPPGIQAFSLMFSESGIRGPYANGSGKTGPWNGTNGRIMGADLKRLMSNIDNLMNLLVLTDDDVQPINRVSLSTLNADDHGPVAKVEFPLGKGRHGPSKTASSWPSRRPRSCSPRAPPRSTDSIGRP